MFALAFDVIDHIRNRGLRNREAPISILPREIRVNLLADPERRIALDSLRCLSRRGSSRRANAYMGVIFDSADLDGCHSVAFCDPAHKCPQAFLAIFMDQRFAVFGAEDEVQVYLGERVCHIDFGFNRRVRDGNGLDTSYRGLRPTATIRHRYAMKRIGWDIIPWVKSHGYNQTSLRDEILPWVSLRARITHRSAMSSLGGGGRF